MATDDLLSFRKQFTPNSFPVEARFYQFGANPASPTLMRRTIASPEALQAFQEELTSREQAHEWAFIAYYTYVPPEHTSATNHAVPLPFRQDNQSVEYWKARRKTSSNKS